MMEVITTYAAVNQIISERVAICPFCERVINFDLTSPYFCGECDSQITPFRLLVKERISRVHNHRIA